MGDPSIIHRCTRSTVIGCVRTLSKIACVPASLYGQSAAAVITAADNTPARHFSVGPQRSKFSTGTRTSLRRNGPFVEGSLYLARVQVSETA